MRKPKIGLALGSGGARGWAHIGVIRALEERGIVPDVVVGTSMGALVGAAYVGGQLDALEKWARSITLRKMAGLIDVNLLSGGLVEAKHVVRFFQSLEMPERIEELDIAFATVATDMRSGREIWIQDGSIIDAMRASIALPGIVSPVLRAEHWLLDGGLTNPLPVSVCRAMGADIVIGVNPEAKEYGVMWSQPPETPNEAWKAIKKSMPLPVRGVFEAVSGVGKVNGIRIPNYFDVVATSIDVMIAQIRRSRLISDPPHVLLEVELHDFSLLDFHNAAAAIDKGRACVERSGEMLESILKGA
ncbi:MAG: patatin-like phospholipase family protein [Paracoccaceae bacterium]|jgi:NTE family protein